MLMTGTGSGNPSSAEGAIPSASSLVTVGLDVTGMHCPSCAALIEESLCEQAGVAEATVDLDAAHAAVTFDPGVAALDDLCAVVVGLGYEVAPSLA
jgi:copper chaperone CopZ